MWTSFIQMSNRYDYDLLNYGWHFSFSSHYLEEKLETFAFYVCMQGQNLECD